MDYSAILRDLENEAAEIEAAMRYFRRKTGESATQKQASSVQQERQSRIANTGKPSLAETVIELLDSRPDEIFSISEVVEETKEDQKNIRSTLARLATEGRIIKRSRGIYTTKNMPIKDEP